MLIKENLLAQAFLNCYEHFMIYRNIESYYLKEELSSKSLANIQGNLATCVLINEGCIIGNTLIAPSFSISGEVREYQRDKLLNGSLVDSIIASKTHTDQTTDNNSRVSIVTDTKTIWITKPDNLDECSVIQEQLSCDDPNNSSDSEHILLNVIDSVLNKNCNLQELVIVLVTERIPCSSCTNTMIKFLKKHASTIIKVGYTFETKSKKGQRIGIDFINQISDAKLSSRAQLQRIYLENNIMHLIR